MSTLVSIILLAGITIPMGIGLLILFRNELEIKDKVTGGYGMPVIFGMILVFIVMPIVVFLSS